MSNELQKYKKGDRVKVIIGHSMWKVGGGKDAELIDIHPQLTEDIATVEYTYGEKSEIDSLYSKGDSGYKRYRLRFDKHGSISWFDEENLIPVL